MKKHISPGRKIASGGFSPKALSCSLVSFLLLATCSLGATTIGYWSFEDGDFLTNSAGGDDLTASATAPTQYGLPATGAGSAFPNPVPGTGVINEDAASFGGSSMFTATDITANSFSAGQLTLEAFIHLTDTTSDNRTIGGFWGSTVNDRRFFFSVQNGNLRVMLREGSQQQAQTALSVSHGVDYYTAVVVTGNQTNDVIFYLKDLTNNGPLQSETLSFNHALTGSAQVFSIGSLPANLGNNAFDGLLDEVRLSNIALAPSQFTIIPEPTTYALMGGMVALGIVFLRRRVRR